MSKPADEIAKTAGETEIEATETREWLEALDYVIAQGGSERVRRLFTRLHTHALKKGIQIPYAANTPYVNTIAPQDQPEFPGDFDVEVRLKSYIRWNAMAMVVRANREADGIGGHISTFASATTLYEVALNHFIRGKGADGGGDLVFFQGHAAPGIYARAFMEGRLTVRQLENFRRELQSGKGLSSYPHPWLMPGFWEFPTVSMGLGPIMAIYQARFNRYLEDRGIKDTSDCWVWAFLGDGETDEPTTTMAIVRVIAKLLREKDGFGKHVVPIIPNEARTFGMEALFSQFGIYSHVGQLYEPTDAGSLMFYREAINGQVIEEGITEAGSISSFIAAGTSYASHGVHMIPFFIFYSMFGFQRVGDLIWAAADMRCRGFLIGGTAGRTTLAGEGLQHHDGNSHLLACTVPNLVAYDPAFAYEIGVIVREGIRRMYENLEDIFYYLTVENESYPMPEMPEGVEEGILKGMYCYRRSRSRAKHRVQLLASGAILNQALSAQKLLSERFNIASDVWSATSIKELHRDGMETDRWNMLHPGEKPRVPYIRQCLGEDPVPIVIASDYVKALPNSLVRWMPGVPVTLGTDGFGRSESREALRDFFEVDFRYIALGALTALARQRKIKQGTLAKAIKELKINPSKPNPLTS